jgi:hypothetical protein
MEFFLMKMNKRVREELGSCLMMMSSINWHLAVRRNNIRGLNGEKLSNFTCKNHSRDFETSVEEKKKISMRTSVSQPF